MKANPIEIYHEAVEKVPAYKEFLSEKTGGIPKVSSLDDFSRLPFTDKKTYLTQYPLENICLNGTLRDKHIFCRSSGTTQKPFYWPQMPSQEKDIHSWLYDELEETFKISTTPTLIIVGLALGPWISGELTTWTLRTLAMEKGNITMVTPGLDRNGVIEAIETFSPYYMQTLIYSYPPFIKNCIEVAKERGIPVENHKIKLRLVGEGYTERFRDYMNALLGHSKDDITSISSGYASTDFGRLGKETMLSVAIKRVLHEENLSSIILGSADIPSVCQFNPGGFYLEISGGELVITKHQAIPLVRYKTGDLGEIIEYDDMLSRFKGENIDILDIYHRKGGKPEAIQQLPFVTVRGRSDGGIVFRGANILVGQIRDILESTTPFKDDFTGNFQIKKTQDDHLNSFIELFLEQKSGAASHDGRELSRIIGRELGARNMEYVAVSKDIGESALPVITVVDKDYFLNNLKIHYVQKEETPVKA